MEKTIDLGKIINPEIRFLTYSPLGYIRWFSPSLDFPCLLNAYYLFPPFSLDKKSSILKVGEEKGEREDILWQVKSSLGQILKNT